MFEGAGTEDSMQQLLDDVLCEHDQHVFLRDILCDHGQNVGSDYKRQHQQQYRHQHEQTSSGHDFPAPALATVQ